MTYDELAAITPLALTMACGGVAFGILYFAALHRTTTMLAAGRGWASPLLMTLCRIGGAVVFLALAAKLGAAALLAAFSGFLVARAAALRIVRSRG